MSKIYVVEWLFANSGYDGSKIIGIFDNKKDAEKVKEIYKEKHGTFEGFYVTEYPLNQYIKGGCFSTDFIHLNEGKTE